MTLAELQLLRAQKELELSYANMNIANINQMIYWANWNLQQPGITEDQRAWYTNQIVTYNYQLVFYDAQKTRLSREITAIDIQIQILGVTTSP